MTLNTPSRSGGRPWSWPKRPIPRPSKRPAATTRPSSAAGSSTGPTATGWAEAADKLLATPPTILLIVAGRLRREPARPAGDPAADRQDRRPRGAGAAAAASSSRAPTAIVDTRLAVAAVGRPGPDAGAGAALDRQRVLIWTIAVDDDPRRAGREPGPAHRRRRHRGRGPRLRRPEPGQGLPVRHLHARRGPVRRGRHHRRRRGHRHGRGHHAAHHPASATSRAPCGTSPTARSTGSATCRSSGPGRCSTSRWPTGTDIDEAQPVIKAVADGLWPRTRRGAASILEPPEVWGVERLGPEAIAIRLVVKTRPADQFPVMRELRRRLADAFLDDGIEMPFRRSARRGSAATRARPTRSTARTSCSTAARRRRPRSPSGDDPPTPPADAGAQPSGASSTATESGSPGAVVSVPMRPAPSGRRPRPAPAAPAARACR